MYIPLLRKKATNRIRYLLLKKNSMELDRIKRIPLAAFCMRQLNYTPNKGHDSRLWRSLKSPGRHHHHQMKTVITCLNAMNGTYRVAL